MNVGQYQTILGAALALVTTVVTADVTLEMDVAAGNQMKQLIQVSEGRVRVTSGVQGQEFIVLYREGSDQYQVLDGKAKTVMTITPQQVRQTMQQASGMMQQMQAMMAEQMKNMTPEQRAQVEQMMGKPAGGARAKPQIRRTKRTEKVGSWNCEVIEVVEGARVTSELCVAKAKTLGISDRDFQTLQAFFKVMGSMADSARGGMGRDMPFFGPEEIPGVPVRASHIRAGKKDIVQLTKVGTDRIASALFTVPDDYQPAQLPGMPGMPGMPTR
ncbi:MAG: DUF4412 domain-containing protein [Proteobacteria bacterium]|nr:MAG: DUF4412 domain-containing protein [Pseudomonadota bacterium]QKK12360.1 MAG: DUF4412 domain-containing protein [Pseudomonadota bacterium]